MAESEIIKATTSFSFTNAAGTPVTVRSGETFHRDSPRLQGLSDEALEGSFDPFLPDHDLEQATAASGEKRNSPRRKKTQRSNSEKAGKQATAAPGEDESSEAAVRLAEENGIDLSTVTGTGKDGRITQPDVQAVIDAAANSSEKNDADKTQSAGGATAAEE